MLWKRVEMWWEELDPFNFCGTREADHKSVEKKLGQTWILYGKQERLVPSRDRARARRHLRKAGRILKSLDKLAARKDQKRYKLMYKSRCKRAHMHLHEGYKILTKSRI